MTSKTHWLQNPNKSYLGHWDLPDGKDVVLTIDKAQWETVKNPSTGSSDEKRVIRFKEKHKWVKPFICNEVNAKNILKSTNEKYMEDCEGKKIKLSISQTKVAREMIDCIRVKTESSDSLGDSVISKDQVKELLPMIEKAKAKKKEKKEEFDFCKAMKIESVEQLPSSKFKMCHDRLKEILNDNS
jgi:hypothetical protein